jgi:hypothetical protein
MQVSGLKESLGLVGNQYSILIAMFTAGSAFSKSNSLKDTETMQELCWPNTPRAHHPESCASLLVAVHTPCVVWPNNVLRCVQDL